MAGYPEEIQKELRLALQAVGRKLGMLLRRQNRVKHEGQRRAIFLRYLGEVAGAVSQINGSSRARLHQRLLNMAKKRTLQADMKLDDRGRAVEEEDADFGKGVLIVEAGYRESRPVRDTIRRNETWLFFGPCTFQHIIKRGD